MFGLGRVATGFLVFTFVLGVLIAVGMAQGGINAQGTGGATSQATPRIESTVGQRPGDSKNALPCTDASTPANFRLYSLGASFQDLPLTAVIRRCDNPDPWGSANYVSYIYGDCEPQPPPGETYIDGGCAPPLEVQIWPACERSLGDYNGDPRVSQPRQLRGVPVAAVDDWVEVYTADSTVVVFGHDQALIERAVTALHPLPPEDAPAKYPPRLRKSDDLPPPNSGALSGQTGCTS
jgi:hypothetical protein